LQYGVKRLFTPGERLAVIEEFEPGEGVYMYGGEVRAAKVGEPVFDMKERRASVRPLRDVIGVPKVGDSVIGVVESTQGNVVNVKIEVVNGRYSQAGFTAMLQVRPTLQSGRGGVRRTVCKPGDVVRARVISNLNSIIHLAMDRPEEGVICTVCSVCGGRVVRVRSRVKCIECSNVEDRKLASDFE